MDQCPKCKHKLRLFQMGQYCPYCGVNVMFANYEPRFQKDRRIAEMSMANFRICMKKFTSAYVSGTAQKVRLGLSFLPLAALFVPFGSLSVDTPLYASSVKFWALDTVYNGFLGKGLFAAMGNFAGTPVFGEAASVLRTVMLLSLVGAVGAVLVLLTELLCFIGNKKTNILTMLFSVVAAAGIAGAGLTASKVTEAAAQAGSLLHASANMLWLAAVVLALLPVAGAVLCLKNPPVRRFAPEDVLRCEYRTKWKNGQIDLLDIPAPIAETEEEKKEREKLIAKAYHTDGEGEDNG